MVTGSDWHSIDGGRELANEFRKSSALPQTTHSSGLLYQTCFFSSAGVVYYTAGIHPCSSDIFSVGGRYKASGEEHDTAPCDPDRSAPIPDGAVDLAKSADIIARLQKIFADAQASGTGHLVAFGEFGLDYDRLHFCNKEVQLHSFAEQLKVAVSLKPQLPLFLHSRAAGEDFARLMREAFGPNLEKLTTGGVVHSFTGGLEEMQELLDLGLYIGINGCSFKTEENCAVVKELPLDRIMIETDGPWCEVRPSHYGWKYLMGEKQQQQPAGLAGLASELTSALESIPGTPATSGTSDVPGTPDTVDTPASDGAIANGTGKKHKPQKQPNHGRKKKQQQAAEPDVPFRFKATKNWTEGCMIKGRNEPCTIERITQIVAGIQGVTVEEVCEAAWRNTNKVFNLGESQ